MSSIDITFELPIYWTQHFKTKPSKTILVGMNWYRNAFYHAQNIMKKDFHTYVATQLPCTEKNFDIQEQFKLKLQIYYKNASCDGANIAALIEKFSLDALQECGIIANDNVKYHLGTTWEVVKQDKENPRCLVTLNKLKKEY